MRSHSQIIDDFPKTDLIYLDNAASSQKLKACIDAVYNFYSKSYSSVHRGSYSLVGENDQKYSDTKVKLARLFNASNYYVVFTGGTTDSINTISHLLNHLKTVTISDHEHHSNILPWASKFDVTVKPYEQIQDIESDIVSITHCCNVTGQVFPVKSIIENTPNSIHIIDGAQSVPHFKVDLEDLNPEFYVFSAHKLYGPTGLGVMFIRKDIAENISPARLGGGIVQNVVKTDSGFNYEYLPSPYKFEAGTPPIAQAIAMATVADYLEALGYDFIASHANKMRDYLLSRLQRIGYCKVIGSPNVPTVSFAIDKMHPHDIATIMSENGIAIRAGHMCAQPTVNNYGYDAVCRISCALYNTEVELDSVIYTIESFSRYL